MKERIIAQYQKSPEEEEMKEIPLPETVKEEEKSLPIPNSGNKNIIDNWGKEKSAKIIHRERIKVRVFLLTLYIES